jgi:predicted nuclease of restriction endonuclease-like RecB superfamily
VLRSEHVLARLSRGRLVPHRLRPDDGRVREVSEALVGLYAARVGEPRRVLEGDLSRLEEELGPRLDPRRGFKVVRALAKLLEERCEWAPPTEADPYLLRTRLFELAAALPEPPTDGPGLLGGETRKELLAQVADEFRVEGAASLMYADRRGEQALAAFDAPTPETLVERYNVAQVQGVLYAATGLTVDLAPEADARLVFRYVKLLGLMYALEPLPGGHRLRLDGPLSLFGGTRKYGLRLAKLLPALLLTGPWTLEADLIWKGHDAKLVLDSETCGLASHYRGPADLGEADVREAFAKAFGRAKGTEGWELRESAGPIPLPRLGTALVPDFALLNRETGEEAHLEILGLHSERYLIERLKLVREASTRGHRVLVATPESLDASPEALAEAARGAVIPFKTRPDPKAVLAALRG